MARAYHKLLAYKDEDEVARLLSDPAFQGALRGRFDGAVRISYHLAPPLFPGRDPATGRPRKRRFGPWLLPLLRVLARLKRLRGTPLDPFGWTAERRAERAAIADFERLIDELLPRLTPSTSSAIAELLALPETIRGFGPVKDGTRQRAKAREQELRSALERERSALAQ